MGINISINLGKDQSSSSATASGHVLHVITDEERKTFKLEDKHLKDAVKAYFGKKPDDAFLHSPTPWNDLYKKYNWPQVQVMLVVKSAEIVEFTSQPLIVKEQKFTNDSSKPANFNVAISETVNNTVSSIWNTGGTLSIEQKFTYKISSFGGETSLSHTRSWGETKQITESITIGSTAGVNVLLQPGEAVKAELSANRLVMKIRIQYKAYLIGKTAVNYNPKYKDHHFWAFDIDDVMSEAGIPNSVKSTEEIEIGYYYNAKVQLKDPKTMSLKASFKMSDIPGPSEQAA